ncbi:MAG: metallophosphoesterase [Candidatus Micrarchaeota archaeon]
MKFVVGEPAVMIGSTLIVSDVHLGMELELQDKGFQVKDYWRMEVKRLNALISRTKAKKIIVLGDFKHDYYGLKNRESRLLTSFLRELSVPLTIIKGNHDSGLQDLPGVTLIEPSGLVVTHAGDSYGLFHGHALPSKEVLESDFLLAGNIHPIIKLEEAEGFVFFDKVFLVASALRGNKLKIKGKLVVFPAFSELVGGFPVNKRELRGPLFSRKLFNLPKASVFLLSGLKLGSLKDLS